ncbi:MAG: helix-turn-helix domain-containing protein [Deferribacterales bacterium]
MNDLAMVTKGRNLCKKEINLFMKRHDINPKIADMDFNSGIFTFSGNFPSLKEMEDVLTRKALESSRGNVSEAAKLLGITRQSLHRYIKLKKL